MGACYRHRCEACGFAATTSGPWEFYRDVRGRPRLYGHREPSSEEAERRGIDGFFGEMYCAGCRLLVDVVIVEYDQPIGDPLAAWLRLTDDEFRGRGTTCPRCGSTSLVFGPGSRLCPRCNDGHLEATIEHA